MFKEELRELYLMQQVHATLFCVANKIQSSCDEKLGSISSRQLMAMIAVAHLSSEDATLKSIAIMLGTSKQNTSKLLNSLKKKDCIEILSNSKDKRSINVRLTQKGIRLMNESAEKNIYAMANIFKELNKEHLETLLSLLQKLARFDGLPYLGFEADMTGNHELSDAEKQILSAFRELRRAK
jgi:DNA-binding MarR family transcriptional regulator